MDLVQSWTPSTVSSSGARTVSGAATTDGNGIVVAVGVRSATATVTVTDNAGNTYTDAGPNGAALSTARVFYCLNADPATSVTATANETVGVAAQVHEIPAGSTLGPVAELDHASTTTFPAVEVTPAAGAVVFSVLVLAVTSRTLTLQGATFTETSNIKGSSLHFVDAYREDVPASAQGPAWNITTGSATNAGQSTVAFNEAATADPPTVSAGTDQTVETGAAAFTLPGTATPPGGASIVSRSWQQQSGPSVTISGSTTDTLTVTPPATAGVAVFRFTATTNQGASAFDDVSVTFVAPGQSLRPNGDVNNSGVWVRTPSGGTLASAIDEVTFDAADYISSPDTPTAAPVTVSLGPGQAPATSTGQIVQVYAWRDSGAATHTLLVELLEGATVRSSATFTDLTTTPVVRQWSLTGGESNAVTDWTALRLRFTATAT